MIVSFIIINLASSISANVNNILVLNGTNFKKWKEHVIIVIGCMDLDFALREDRQRKTNRNFWDIKAKGAKVTR